MAKEAGVISIGSDKEGGRRVGLCLWDSKRTTALHRSVRMPSTLRISLRELRIGLRQY